MEGIIKQSGSTGTEKWKQRITKTLVKMEKYQLNYGICRNMET